MTPDGRHVAFVGLRDGGIQTAWIVPLDGGEPMQITDAWAGVMSLAVSPDSRRIAFMSSDAQNDAILLICGLPTCVNRQEPSNDGARSR